jgi:TRAP-type C4-dicarboxylate transport system permease small subunit
LKGLYWLILGLCAWFIPFIIFQVIMTSGTEKTAEEAVSEIPKELIYVTFPIALGLILKGVFTIRKERKSMKTEDDRKKKSKK